MGIPSIKGRIVNETIARFPKFGNLTIARIILYNDGDYFDNNLENIRGIVRHYRGASGEHSACHKVDGKPITPKMPKTKRQIREPYKLEPGLWLVLADIHAPFHEPVALEAAINFGKKNKATGVLLLGDLQDCQSISFWPQTRKRDYDAEIYLIVDMLNFIRHEFPKAKIVYKLANHEYRLPANYYRKAPELAGIPLAATNEIFDLEGKGIEAVDYSQLVFAGLLPIYHGHEIRISTVVNPARGLFLKTSLYGLCAHFHQTSLHPGKNVLGELLTTHSVGCLCDLSPDYNPYGNSWNHGTALINVEKNGSFEIENRRILSSGKIV